MSTMTDPYAPLSGKPAPSPERAQGDCVMPVPATAPTPRLDHHVMGKPARVWEYRDAAGELLGYACRYVTGQGKETRVWSLWKDPSGRLVWRCKHWPKPKPLYGLDRLAARLDVTVIICEGEKATDAATTLMPTHVAICWPGGANAARHADWRALKGRVCILWPDHDEAGHTAVASASECLRGAGATSVEVLNLGALAAYLQGGCAGTKAPSELKPKDDAADLLDREQWTAQTMAAFLSLPEVTIKPQALLKDAEQHAGLVQAVEGWLETQKYDVDATGGWMQDNKPARDIGHLPELVAHKLKFKRKAPTDRVREILNVVNLERSQERAEAIISAIIGQPSTEAGVLALARWCELVTGEQDELTYAVMRHWIWLVKRSIASLPREQDIMPILYHGAHGGGKSTALRKLCAPLAEIVEPINAEVLTDDRRATELERFVIGIWDEMEGADRKDLTAIKSTITCEQKTYRILTTHTTARVIRRMNFIGTSNKPVDQIIRDTTGARRFFQVNCTDAMDWEAINRIDYHAIWTCVSEHDPAPIIASLPVLRAHQAGLKHRDTVSLWLANMSRDRFTWEITSDKKVEVPAYSDTEGEEADDVRWRYLLWCKLRGEQAVGGNFFWQRLKEEGVTKTRSRKNGQKIHFLYPCISCIPVHISVHGGD